MAPFAKDISTYYKSDAARKLMARIDENNIPRHVAVIMDGNGRWAKSRFLPRIAGHKSGAVMVRELIASSIELGIEFLTIYSFSTENWTRPADEVSGIMKLFVEVLMKELDSLMEKDVRVKVIGKMDSLPSETKKAFDDCTTKTKDNSGLTLVVALNYGARDDIVLAVKRIAESAVDGGISIDEIDSATIANNLSTKDIPDPDLLIRTSGEVRISNFLLYEIAYSEIVISDVLWPDFDRDEYLKCIASYMSRTRRYGGL